MLLNCVLIFVCLEKCFLNGEWWDFLHGTGRDICHLEFNGWKTMLYFMEETMACGFRLCRLNSLCAKYRKKFSVKIFSYSCICTENMNIKCRCDYFDVSYNRQTEKQTNKQTDKHENQIWPYIPVNKTTHVHTRTHT